MEILVVWGGKIRYNSGIDNLDLNQELPKYLLENRDAKRQIKKLKSKMLKQSYNKVLKEMSDINSKAFKKAMHSALQEKARYYATRIATTEASRSRNLSRAKEYLDDKEVKLVKFTMSSEHSIVDICNYYASLDVGYGAGVVPKELMRVLPLHPHCHCRYHAEYRDIKRKTIKNPVDDTMNKFSDYEKRQILGSHDKLQDFKNGAGIESIFNRVRPKYPIAKHGDVLGYNGGMNFIKENARPEELKVIKDWSTMDKCALIRNVYYFPDEAVENYIKKDVQVLESMFNKYDSSLNKKEVIYRGISFLKTNTKKVALYRGIKEALEVAVKTDDVIMIDIAPSSFSRTKDIAYNFGNVKSDKHFTIIYELKERYSNEIDIKEGMNSFPEQKEVIIRSQKSTYKVLSINEKDYDTIVIEIIEKDG